MLNFIYIHSSDKLCDFTVQLRCNVRICLVSKTITKLPHCLFVCHDMLPSDILCFLFSMICIGKAVLKTRKTGNISQIVLALFFSIHRQVSLSATPFPFLYVSSTENAKRNKDIIIFLTTYQKWENENVSCALCWSIHLLNDVLFKILEFSNILCLVYSQSIVFSCNPSTVLQQRQLRMTQLWKLQ